MLKIAIPNTRSQHYFAYSENETFDYEIPEGAIIRLKAGVQLPPSGPARVIAQALQTYGAVVGDTTGDQPAQGGDGPAVIYLENLLVEGSSYRWSTTGLEFDSLASLPLTTANFEIVDLGIGQHGMWEGGAENRNPLARVHGSEELPSRPTIELYHTGHAGRLGRSRKRVQRGVRRVGQRSVRPFPLAGDPPGARRHQRRRRRFRSGTSVLRFEAEHVRRGDRAHLPDVERWRAGRLARLTAHDGWLSLAGLAWLREGDNSVGGDPAADVVIPGAGVAAALGTILVRNGRALARLAPGAAVTAEGEPVPGSLALHDDALGEPTRIRVGRVTLHVIRREGRLAARISDPENPARRSFRGIEHFPVDSRWRLEARFQAYEPERTVAVPTVLGYDETYRMPGVLSFDLAGATHRLDAFLQPGEDDLFLVFADTTNGRETYGGGRYLYAPPPDERGIVVVDFNRAYNPPCVFTPHATCPLPLPQNRLPIRVEAGEKRYD